MAKWYIKYETMKNISSQINAHSTFQDVLMCLAKSEEFADLAFHQGEKGFLAEVIKRKELRYGIKGKVTEKWQRVFCLIQLQFSDNLKDGKLLHDIMQDLHFIHQHSNRILKSNTFNTYIFRTIYKSISM